MNSCRLGLTTGGELAKALAAEDTAFWAVARALASSVSDPDSDPDPDPDLDLDPSPVVLVARPAFWAAVILPRLFSRATALVN